MSKKRLYGPIGLLHHWSWTRFPFGRPSPLVKGWAPDWGKPNGQTCPAYAMRWCSEKSFYRTPHGRPTGVAFFRSQFEQMRPDEHVCWRPYDEQVENENGYGYHSFLDDLPTICSEQRHFWLAQVPLVFLGKKIIPQIYNF